MSSLPSIILYADDDKDDQVLMREAINEIGEDYVLICVTNGMAATKKLDELTSKNMQPCMIALDGNMPVMTGKETVAAIRSNKAWDNIPVCIFSTSAEKWFDDITEKYNVPVYRKPTTVAAFKEVVREMLHHCAR